MEMNEALKVMQRNGLEILKAVDAFCKQENIAYVLYCGTLLGSIRHQGFIPWDDDIDIAMPLKDYRRFVRTFEMAGYTLLAPERPQGQEYYLPFAKVYKDDTICVRQDELNYPCHQGFSLDVYPLIGAPRNKTLQKLQTSLIALAAGLLAAGHPRTKVSPKRKLYSCLNILPYGFRRRMAVLLLHLCMSEAEKHKRCGTIDAVRFSGKFATGLFQGRSEGLFEGDYYPIPERYDTILKIMYGDYMRPPKERYRKAHYVEDMIIADKEKIDR